MDIRLILLGAMAIGGWWLYKQAESGQLLAPPKSPDLPSTLPRNSAVVPDPNKKVQTTYTNTVGRVKIYTYTDGSQDRVNY